MVSEPCEKMKEDFLSQADQMARDLAVRFDCDAVFISLANTDDVLPFGVSTINAPDVSERGLRALDTICAVTTERNELVVFHDTRKAESIMDREFVRSGHVVGYMGYPIRDEFGHAIGAICATTKDPRIWSMDEQLTLKAAGSQAEMLLATAILKRENLFMSRTLGEYDEILGAIALHAGAMLSIHSNSGGLLFATNALLKTLSSDALEEMIHRALTTKKAQDQSRHGMEASWRPTIHGHSGALIFAQWDRVTEPQD